MPRPVARTEVGASGRPGSSENRPKHNVGLHELRAEAVQTIAVLTLISSYLAFISLSDEIHFYTWLPAIALAATGLIVHRLAPAHRLAASALLIGALWVILSAVIFFYSTRPLAPVYSLLVFMAAFLFGPRTAVLLALGSGALLVAGPWILPHLAEPALTDLALFMLGSAALLAWLMAGTLTTVIDWMWAAYAQDEADLAIARARQAELVRLTKSLNETLDKLEDLTRRLHEARAAAEAARRLKAEFAAAVSHELRTPLNLIIGFAELLVLPQRLRASQPVPDVHRGPIEAIYRNACHISNLVDDILDLSQIDAQRLALYKEPLTLREVVEEAAAAVVNLFQEEGLFLEIDVPADLPQLHADRTRVRQVLTNLLTNASRFTDDGGVTIRAWSDGRDVTMAVTDTGIGIPPQELPFVFQEFRFARRGGTGLGLTICKWLIELHGGNMWVESVPGAGSTFFFSLPIGNTVAAVPGGRPLESRIKSITSREARRTLLVVDSDGHHSKILGRYLDGYRIRRVQSVEKAKHLIDSGDAAAIVLGSVPTAQSWPVGQMDDSRPYMVAFCPLSRPDGNLQELGVAGYLTKPVRFSQLKAALRHLGVSWHTVGIVEDHREMADLLVQMVRNLHERSQVWLAADGREALIRMREQPPDVLMLDLLLPGLNGYDLLREIQSDEQLRQTPVLVITGADDRDEKIVAEMVGITRSGGLTVGEAMACLKGSLDSLLAVR